MSQKLAKMPQKFNIKGQKLALHNYNQFITAVAIKIKCDKSQLFTYRTAHVHQIIILFIFFTALSLLTIHVRFCWVYECDGQSEVFRLLNAENAGVLYSAHSPTDLSMHVNCHHKQRSAEKM